LQISSSIEHSRAIAKLRKRILGANLNPCRHS